MRRRSSGSNGWRRNRNRGSTVDSRRPEDRWCGRDEIPDGQPLTEADPLLLSGSMDERVKVAVVGASGYSGEELVGLLLRHPRADLVCATSRTEAGRLLDEVFPRFRDSRNPHRPVFVAPDLKAILASGATFVFLALPHGLA